MTPRTFRKKPVEVEAMQLTTENAKDICDWMQSAHIMGYTPESHQGHGIGNDGVVLIDTREGQMTADIGDWVIRGVHGEFYPCKPDIFADTYEVAEDEDVA